MTHAIHTLKIKDLGIDTYKENIVFMRADCHVCKSEGYTALTRVVISANNMSIVATLNVIYSNLLEEGEAALSVEAMNSLNVSEGDMITVSHLSHIMSLSKVRAKMFHKALSDDDFMEIIGDVVLGYYSNIELAAFVTACAGNNLTVDEIIGLTKAMIKTGKTIRWNTSPVYDKHCIGGLPGNRTTPIVVSIVAAAGLTIPKTSSRAITSPAGTADTMEVLTNVNLSISDMQKIVQTENACMAWGGAVQLSPADDILIAIEKSLDVDSEAQMIASVISKKIAAGSTHAVIDIPYGPTAKVRSREAADRLSCNFKKVGNAVGMVVETLITDGSQPVGKGIGPALEAMDVLAVLKNEEFAPADLKQRAIDLAMILLKMSGKYKDEQQALDAANELLNSGKAYDKFVSICKAQGAFKTPLLAEYRMDILSETNGMVRFVNNRRLAKVAKLAGAPRTSGAGVWFNAPIGKEIRKGDLLFSIYAGSKGELQYSKDYFQNVNELIIID